MNDRNGASVAQQEPAECAQALDSEPLKPVSLTVVFQRRHEKDSAKDGIIFSGYDIHWPDGRPVTVGLQRFCNQGTRLLLGRAQDRARSVVRITLYPVDGVKAHLTRPGQGIRCRRFFAVRDENQIRFHFFTGDRTEIVFDERDDPQVLHWLHAKDIRAHVAFSWYSWSHPCKPWTR